MDSGSGSTDLSQISSHNKGPSLPLTSLDHLTQQQDNTTKRKRLWDENANATPSFSTASIMKLAKERFLLINSRNIGSSTALPLASELKDQSESKASFEDSEDMELALLLQAAAEKVANQQWVQAQKLLKLCDLSVSINGNPVQMIVYYFSEGFCERIGHELGRSLAEEFAEKVKMDMPLEVIHDEINFQPYFMEDQKEFPLHLALLQ